MNSSVLAGFVEAWVASEDNVTLQGVQLQFDHACLDEVVVEDLNGPECASISELDSDSGSLSAGEAFGVAIAVVVVVVLTLVATILLLVINQRRVPRKWNRYLIVIL